MYRIFLAAAAFAVFATGNLTAADPKAITPDPLWKGSVDDVELSKDAPSVIGDAKAFAKLWESWKLGDKVPEIDFKKNLVVLTTGRGSILDLRVMLNDKADLRVFGFGTKDLRPGFRYAVGVVSREGVKTVNGKKLP